MKIKRALETNILKRWKDNKIVVVTGPRQVGKTTLLHKICKSHGDYLFFNGDDSITRNLLVDFSKKKWQNIIGKHKVVFIDEAQRIDEIGLGTKIIYDQLPDVKVILSGSSALDLNAKIKEPLTGRKWEYFMFPISWKEYVQHTNLPESLADLENRLIYGMYPEVIMKQADAYSILTSLTGSYLYKDLFEYQGIKNPGILQDLLKALALQLGSEVSFNELSQLLQIDRATVEKYIDLLEKAYVIFRLGALNNNQRNEIRNSRKIYFYDNGVRNSIINNFNDVSLRTDVGALWENFIISERKKLNSYNGKMMRTYFWRNYSGQEVDYVEWHSGKHFAFEMKWSIKKKSKLPTGFSSGYPGADYQVINRDNFYEFVL